MISFPTVWTLYIFPLHNFACNVKQNCKMSHILSYYTYENHKVWVISCTVVKNVKINFKVWHDISFLFSFQSLLLLSYLILNGSERVVTSAREHLYDLKSLESYTCTDEFNRDQGNNGKMKRALTFNRWPIKSWFNSVIMSKFSRFSLFFNLWREEFSGSPKKSYCRYWPRVSLKQKQIGRNLSV